MLPSVPIFTKTFYNVFSSKTTHIPPEDNPPCVAQPTPCRLFKLCSNEFLVNT